MTGRPDHVLIRRTGREPLWLEGYGLAAQASSRTPSGPRQTRWHELEWWSHDGQASGPKQRHCLVVRYRSSWEGELGHDAAHLLLRRDLASVLGEIDPLAHVAGYPPGEHYAERQRRLLQSIRHGYEHAVSDLFATAAQDMEKPHG